ncbi:MAG: hypothetical protein M5U08_14535 [Burkholderiales bacterium]|nr:hypothetical protein [Burkholderiales bacterium]
MTADGPSTNFVGAPELRVAHRTSARGDVRIAQRNSTLELNEMQADFAQIERRARAMRVEALWTIAGTLRDWMMIGLGRFRAAARGGTYAGLHRSPHTG